MNHVYVAFEYVLLTPPMTVGRQLKDRTNSVFIHLLATTTDVVQLGARSGVFRDERVLVAGLRLVVFTGRWLFLFGRRKRRVVTSEPSARAFDCAAVWTSGQSPLRARIEREYCESDFHLIFLLA